MIKELERLIKIYNVNKSNFSDVSWPLRYSDEPQIFTFNIFGRNLNTVSDGSIFEDEPHSSGTSFDLETALLKSMGEIFERYCCSSYKLGNLKFGTMDDILGAQNTDQFIMHLNSIDWKKVSNKKNNEASSYYWKNVKKLDDPTKELYLPAQLIYTNYKQLINEKFIQFPSSNGAAAAFSEKGAICRGILELIEREAFLIYYLNKLTPKKVNYRTIKNPVIRKMLMTIRRYGLDIQILNITTDLEVPVYLAIIRDKTGVGMPISFGCKASYSHSKAVIGAIEEALQVRTWIRNIYETHKEKYFVDRPENINSITQRGIYWYDKKLISTLSFFTKSLKKINLPDEAGSEISDNALFIKLKKSLKKNNIDIYYTDLTLPNIKKSGYHVFKVISPHLVPIYFNEQLPYHKCNRIYTVPVKLGLLVTPLNSNNLNKVPHPFL